MIPPELVKLLMTTPAVLILLILAAPFATLAGVLGTLMVQRVKDKGTQVVAEKTVVVSEKDADTRSFQAIVDGFSKSLDAVSKRADSAETKAVNAETKADAAELEAAAAKTDVAKLERRVGHLEGERNDAIRHIEHLETLVPPPGPPPRPSWMRVSGPFADDEIEFQ